MDDAVIVAGAGGHARVVIDLLLESGVEVAAMVADGPAHAYRDIPVLVGDEHLADLATQHTRYVIAIGDNATRLRLGRHAEALGMTPVTALGRTAAVSPTAELALGVVVMNGAVINSLARIGALTIVNTAASVDHDCVLGEGVHVGPGARLAGNVIVGAGTLIGAGATVIPGVRIGESSIVGAGSVVLEDVPDGTTVVGAPARVLEATA